MSTLSLQCTAIIRSKLICFEIILHKVGAQQCSGDGGSMPPPTSGLIFPGENRKFGCSRGLYFLYIMLIWTFPRT